MFLVKHDGTFSYSYRYLSVTGQVLFCDIPCGAVSLDCLLCSQPLFPTCVFFPYLERFSSLDFLFNLLCQSRILHVSFIRGKMSFSEGKVGPGWLLYYKYIGTFLYCILDCQNLSLPGISCAYLPGSKPPVPAIYLF